MITVYYYNMSRTAKMTAVLGLSVYAVVLLLTPCSNGETRFDHRGKIF